MSGMGGHQLPVFQNDEWLTPRYVLDSLGRFDLDPCACTEPRPWPTADKHYTVIDNGLSRPWPTADRVFLNPPYGSPAIVGPWMRRMVAHGNGIALIFARTETALFHETIWHAADAVFFFLKRLNFCYRDGTVATNNGGAPSCLAAYGQNNVDVLQQCGLNGRLIILK